jgi:hypothetical protein
MSVTLQKAWRPPEAHRVSVALSLDDALVALSRSKVDAVRIVRGRQLGTLAFRKARGLSCSTLPRLPSSLHLASLCEHFRMLGSRLRRVAARHLPGHEPSLPITNMLQRPTLGAHECCLAKH